MAKKSDVWKPAAELLPEDFDRSAIWSFDVRRAKTDRLADETYVRPMAPRDRSEVKDAIFLQATFRTLGEQAALAGAIVMRFAVDRGTLKRDALPTVEGLAFLRPYDLFAIRNEPTLSREPEVGEGSHHAVLRTAAGAVHQWGTLHEAERARLEAELALRQRSLPLSYDATLRIGVEFYRFEGTLK